MPPSDSIVFTLESDTVVGVSMVLHSVCPNHMVNEGYYYEVDCNGDESP